MQIEQLAYLIDTQLKKAKELFFSIASVRLGFIFKP